MAIFWKRRLRKTVENMNSAEYTVDDLNKIVRPSNVQDLILETAYLVAEGKLKVSYINKVTGDRYDNTFAMPHGIGIEELEAVYYTEKKDENV